MRFTFSHLADQTLIYLTISFKLIDPPNLVELMHKLNFKKKTDIAELEEDESVGCGVALFRLQARAYRGSVS